MTIRTALSVLACAAFFFITSVGRAEVITMNVCPAGTNSNQTLFGTVLTDGSATWPNTASQYRDYEFELLTTSGSATFDGFAVQLSASLRLNTPSNNLLRATLWAGPIVTNPLLSNSLVTISVPNSAFTNGSSSYTTSLTLTGPAFAAQTITTTPSTFFFRVWAEGAGQNNGYQTKMAASFSGTNKETVTMLPSDTIDGLLDVDNTIIPIVEVVPEPSTLALGACSACLAVAFRRRRAATHVSGQRIFQS